MEQEETYVIHLQHDVSGDLLPRFFFSFTAEMPSWVCLTRDGETPGLPSLLSQWILSTQFSLLAQTHWFSLSGHPYSV
jgi:hypothetical protein